MSAWTIKTYAPKVKLYVHIRQSQSRIHLDIAGTKSITYHLPIFVGYRFISDQVLCEGELVTSILALNSVCPGISTLLALLMHTFTFE